MALSEVEFLDKLRHSQIYRNYAQAFTLATDLPLRLRPSGNGAPVPWEHSKSPPAHFPRPRAGNARNSRKTRTVPELRTAAAARLAGLCDTSVPVRIGQKLVGFLEAGQVVFEKPTPAKFKLIEHRLRESGTRVDWRELREVYLSSRVLSPQRYSGIVHLLEIFATHLEAIANTLSIQDSFGESSFSRRAKAYVTDHQADPISLDEISHALHVSTFYFCKMFKKATSLTFTEYLGRVRIERAKTLLLNPNQRVSEIAFEIGFGSLTHFNRLFKRLVGVSPSDFRETAQRLDKNLPASLPNIP